MIALVPRARPTHRIFVVVLGVGALVGVLLEESPSILQPQCEAPLLGVG